MAPAGDSSALRFGWAEARSVSAVACASLAAFALLSVVCYDFVLDDAFITYRFAENLARTGGFVWNVGDAPVEGFTSLLWVLLNAGAVFVGLSPVVFSKAVSVAAAAALIWLLAIASRHLPKPISFVLVSALGMSMPFVFLTWQGMETTLVALLLLISALLSVTIPANPSSRMLSAWYAVAFTSAIARPDTVVFNAGVAVGLLVLLAQRDRASVLRFFGMALPWIVVAGAYEWWRWQYFGFPLPNTFYVKSVPAAGFAQLQGTGYQFGGLEYVANFGYTLVFPYLILAVLGVASYQGPWRRLLTPVLPILIGCAMFVSYVATIIPIQGFFWRFLMPIFPAFLAAIAVVLSRAGEGRARFGTPVAGWALAVLFAGWSLYLVPQGLYEKRFRTQQSRVQVGERLHGLTGTMLIEDSGAIPYYSRWRTADVLGLVSSEITHVGLSREFLEKLDPDVVCMYIEQRNYNGARSYGERGRIITDHLVARDFVAVAVIHKSFNNWNYYFVRRGSPIFAEVVERLLSVPDVEYGPLEEMMQGEDVPAYKPRKG